MANFQRNSRNIPTAKLFHSKQTQMQPQPSTTLNNDTTTTSQQQKTGRTMIFNGISNERTFQATENAPTVPSLVRKSSENSRLTKHEDNTVERSTSLQVSFYNTFQTIK